MTTDALHQAAHHLRIANGLLEDRGLRSALSDNADATDLLEAVQDMLSAAPTCPQPTVRSLHHMACSGGTLIAALLASQSNVRLLSEINPFSSQTDTQQLFRPTDVSFQARHGVRPVDQQTLRKLFVAEIDVLLQSSHVEGLHLLLRDHSHSAYCMDDGPQAGPPLFALLQDAFPTRALVTVRHPLDCYLGLMANGWLHFVPGDLGEYCRRVMLFLDDHVGVQTMRYEDIVADPTDQMERACDALGLGFDAAVVARHQTVAMSGRSGRQSGAIATRLRRPVPAQLRAQTAEAVYKALCDRLGYNPDPDARAI